MELNPFYTKPENGTGLDLLIYSDEFSSESPYSTTSLILPNNATVRKLPIDMQFNDGHRLAITIYSLLMLSSAIGNIYVFKSIVGLNKKGKLSRINLFLLHLTIADLLVTFFMMPLEIGWHYTVSWQAGDLMCRLMSFLRIFGLYLSGFVLVVISLDLFFAVVKPLGIAYADGRAKIMLGTAWIASFICSLPQPVIFHVEKHPQFKWYEQCVTFNSFPSKKFENAYNMFSFFFLYLFPLTMIIFCYSCILYAVHRVNTKKSSDEQLRRSNTEALGRARVRTLKMTITIVATFFLCWTPYNIMSLWYWFDSKSAQAVDQRIQKVFFLFACTNSVFNPVIYGFFHFRKNQSSAVPGTSAQSTTRRLSRNRHETSVQCRQNGCRVRVVEGNSGTDISDVSLTRNRDVNRNTQTRVAVTISDCEALSCGSKRRGSSSGSPVLMGKFATQETQI